MARLKSYYYINSENSEELGDIQALRKDMVLLQFLLSLFQKNGAAKVVCDSSSEDDILDFIS